MTEGTKEILNRREDYSDYLFHFTKGQDALGTLRTILNIQEILAVKDDVICFTEAPLTVLCEMFDYFTEKYPQKPMFAPYGIGFKKSYLYSLGARHVIYGDEQEKNECPDNWLWRYVEYDPDKNEFSWLREWRLKPEDGGLKLDYDNAIVVTNTIGELKSLSIEDTMFDIDGDIDDGQSHFEIVAYETRYRCITFEQIRNKNKQYMNQLLDQQETKIILDHGSM